jgi:prepilin-type N-terminal cleavage/methylation domain-containing protein/prepilin-type processing-associated H-X9-DG protein
MAKHERQIRGGFTLVELLVVIAIISLLVGIVFPSLGQAKEIARRAYCRNNLHSAAVAFRMYLNGSNDFMPYAASMPSLGISSEPAIAEVLAPFLDQPDMLRCPSDTVKTYFDSEGSSYEYRSMLGGRKADEGFLAQRIGAENVPVMHDYQPFHGPPGKSGSANYLFADLHVGDLVE